MARHATPRHAWHVDKSPGKTHKNQNARLDDLRSGVKKKLRVYTASDANWLIYNKPCHGNNNMQHVFDVTKF